MRDTVLSSFPNNLSRFQDSTHNYFTFGENYDVAYRLKKNIREVQPGKDWLGQVLTDTLPITITNRVKDVEKIPLKSWGNTIII